MARTDAGSLARLRQLARQHDRPGWHPAPAAAARALQPGVTLAVSLEPQGGSKTGLPTGPVVLTGKLAQAS